MRKLIFLPAAAAAFAATRPCAALAHGGGGAADTDGLVLLTILAAGLFYATGVGNIRIRGAFDRVIGWKAASAFALGLVAMWAALTSPLERLSQALFSAHMAQHLALIMVCAPLFVLGRPAQAFIWAFPQARRRRLLRGWRTVAGTPIGALVASPPMIWLLFLGLFGFWHLPGPYAFALRRAPAHIAEHLCLLISAYAFWAVAFGYAAGVSRGGRLLFVASAALLSALPGALICIAPRPLYPSHADAAARFGLTPLEDQQLAGLVMWIPAGFLYLAVILGLLFLWLRDAERRQCPRRSVPLIVLLLIGAALSGCGEESAGSRRRAALASAIPGDPAKGADEIKKVGCGSCHMIPGIAGANGLVGPPLDHMGRRIYIAGLLRQTPENLARWIRDPQSIAPGNAMPNMGLSEEQARNIAAYLSNLR
jgi:putative membrane protein